MESDKENTESICNEASNIYTDIEDFDLGREIEKLTLENKLLEDHIGSLQGDIEKLSSALLKLKSIQENLTKNISSLYLTAKNEIERKDRIIADLRSQLDNITFRRMGIRHQKRKPEEALEASNKKTKFQETDTCSGSNNRKSSRQQTNKQDIILIDDDSNSSSSKNLVDENVLTIDQQNRKDNGTEEHPKKAEESNCSNDKNLKEFRNRSKSIDRRQQNIDNGTYKNRSKSRDRRKQNDDNSPHWRQEENDGHDNYDNCRYGRPDYGYNDERFDERTRVTKTEKEIVIQNEDTRQCAKSETVPDASSDMKDNSCKKTGKPVRKKLRVVDRLEKEIKKKQEEKLSFTPNNSVENISISTIDDQEVNSTKKIGNIFTDGIHGIMDDVLQNINEKIHGENKPPDQINQDEDLGSIEDSYSFIKLQWRLSSENPMREEHAEAFQNEEGTKKNVSEEQEETVESNRNKMFDKFSEVNNFDYSSGESGTVRENIMKQSDMESLLRQTLSNPCTENVDGPKIRNESKRTPSKDIIIVSNIMIPKELTKIEISVDGVNKTHLDESLNVDPKTNDKIDVSEVQHSITNKDSMDTEKQIEFSSTETDVKKIISDGKPVTKPSSDGTAIQENELEIFNPLPQMNPSYKIPKKNPNLLKQDQCNTLSDVYDPSGEPSGYERSASREQRGSNPEYSGDSRSHKSKSEGRHKNRDNCSPRYHKNDQCNQGYNPQYQRHRSREENYYFNEELSSRSRSTSRFQPTGSRSRSIEAEDRARDYSNFHWNNEQAVDTHLSRSTSRHESRHYSSRSRSYARFGTRRYRSRSISEADDTGEHFNQATYRSKTTTEADELDSNSYQANQRYRSKSITEKDELDRDSQQANRGYISESITDADEMGRDPHQVNRKYRSRSITESDRMGKEFHQGNIRYRSRSITKSDETGRDYHQANRKSRSKTRTRADEIGRDSNQERTRYGSRSTTRRTDYGRYSEAKRYRSKSINEVGRLVPERKSRRTSINTSRESKEDTRCRSVTPMPSEDLTEMSLDGRWETDNRTNANTTHMSPDGPESPDECMETRLQINFTRRVIGLKQYSERLQERKELLHEGKMDSILNSNIPSSDYEKLEGEATTGISHEQLEIAIDRRNLSCQDTKVESKTDKDDQQQNASQLTTQKNNLSEKFLNREFANSAKKTTNSNLWKLREIDLGEYDRISSNKRRGMKQRETDRSKYKVFGDNILIGKEENVMKRDSAQSPEPNATIADSTKGDKGQFSVQCPIQQSTSQIPMDKTKGGEVAKFQTTGVIDHLILVPLEDSSQTTKQYDKASEQSLDPITTDEIVHIKREITQPNISGSRQKREIAGNKVSVDESCKKRCLPMLESQETFLGGGLRNSLEKNESELVTKSDSEESKHTSQLSPTHLMQRELVTERGSVIGRLKTLDRKKRDNKIVVSEKENEIISKKPTTNESRSDLKNERSEKANAGKAPEMQIENLDTEGITAKSLPLPTRSMNLETLKELEIEALGIVPTTSTEKEKNNETKTIPLKGKQKTSMESISDLSRKESSEDSNIIGEKEKEITSKNITTNESTTNSKEGGTSEKSNAGKASEMQIEDLAAERLATKSLQLPKRSINLEKLQGSEIEAISNIPKSPPGEEKTNETKTIPVKGKRRTLMNSIRDLSKKKTSGYSKEKKISPESRTVLKEDKRSEKANSGKVSEMQIVNLDTVELTGESLPLPPQSMHLEKLKELEIPAINILPKDSIEKESNIKTKTISVKGKRRKLMETIRDLSKKKSPEHSNMIDEKSTEKNSKNLTTCESGLYLEKYERNEKENGGKASEMQIENLDIEGLTAENLKELKIEAIGIVPKTSTEKEKNNETETMPVKGKRRKSIDSIRAPTKKKSSEDSKILGGKTNTRPNVESKIENDETKEPKPNVESKARSVLLLQSKKSTPSSKKLPNSKSNSASNINNSDEKNEKIEIVEKEKNKLGKVKSNASNEDESIKRYNTGRDLIKQTKADSNTMPELLKTCTGKVLPLKTNNEKLQKQNSSLKEHGPRTTSTTVESVKNLTEEAFSETISIQSTPNKNRPEFRKRITPIPVKDTPICSFENILVRNQSPFHTEPSIQMSPLTLTHEGEIPVLHLEDNHFHNLRGDSQCQKIIDTNIMSLLDQMNISNMDCDIMKFGSTNDKAESAEPPSGVAVTFENTINAPPSVPGTCDPQKPSDNSQKTFKEVQSEMQKDTPPSGQNTSNVRRRRRCRLVVID